MEDTTDMHNTTSKAFPIDEDFNDSNEKTITWNELPKCIYHIITKEKIKTGRGQVMILELQNKLHDSFTVWAPDRLKANLDENPYVTHIKHKG